MNKLTLLNKGGFMPKKYEITFGDLGSGLSLYLLVKALRSNCKIIWLDNGDSLEDCINFLGNNKDSLCEIAHCSVTGNLVESIKKASVKGSNIIVVPHALNIISNAIETNELFDYLRTSTDVQILIGGYGNEAFQKGEVFISHAINCCEFLWFDEFTIKEENFNSLLGVDLVRKIQQTRKPEKLDLENGSINEIIEAFEVVKSG
ncbi:MULTISPECIES: hypothetical protein [Pseudoalteromonas]|uniref:hypothetical protein n=1 Tax=Pseudoalteromonas TaxID=53246 RepID=UPI001583A230|nr:MULTISPECIES: hypothetical protein [Pseudoalteromonas]MDI4653620.1 hypothetical protein [Pseudoalteromonas shioyasakiensis]NUJ39345.1 hypothetical protein [Pseudoalteromonas sp. 0303]